MDDLWLAYKEKGDLEARERLIVEHQPLVKYVADRVGAGLPSHVDRGDLISYGVFGLIDAVEKFDLGRNVKFEAYAMARIKGAILDGLRSTDWVPRSVRSRARSVERALEKLERELSRTPTEQELAEELEVTPQALRTLMGGLAASRHLFIDQAGQVDSRDYEYDSLAEVLPDRFAHTADEIVEHEEMAEHVSRGVTRVADRDRIILTLYYFEGLTLADIGRVLGVTESRICQMHDKAVLALRDSMLVAA